MSSCESYPYGLPNQLAKSRRLSATFTKQFPQACRPSSDGQLDGSVNGSGLAVDDPAFCAGSCMAFVDPGLGPNSAELNNATGFSHVLKYSSPSSTSPSSPRFPNTVITSLVLALAL